MNEFSVYYDEQNKCLRGKLSGKLTILSLSDYVKEVQKQTGQSNKRLVSDFTETALDISTIEIIGIPEMLASMGLDDTWKRAIVLSKKIDDFELYSVLANNKGYTVRPTEDQLNIECNVLGTDSEFGQHIKQLVEENAFVMIGSQLRTYRLACAATRVHNISWRHSSTRSCCCRNCSKQSNRSL